MKFSELYVALGIKDGNFKRGMNNAKRQTSMLSKQMKQLGGMIAGAFAVRGLINFTKQAIKAYDVQIKAETSLLTALKGRVDVQKRLIRQASDLQQTTLFGDEETIKAQALLAALGLTEEQIKTLMPAIQDMATGLGMDLTGAASLAGKSVTTTTDALARYFNTGLKGVISQQERAVVLTQALTDKFEGQAEAASKVGSGPMIQLANAWGDLGEVWGKFMVNGAGVVGMLNSLKEGLAGLTGFLSSEYLSGWDRLWVIISGGRALPDVVSKRITPTIEGLESQKESLLKLLRTLEQGNPLYDVYAKQLREINAKLIELKANAEGAAGAGGGGGGGLDDLHERVAGFDYSTFERKPMRRFMPLIGPGQVDPSASVTMGMPEDPFQTDMIIRNADTMTSAIQKVSDQWEGYGNVVSEVMGVIGSEMQEMLGVTNSFMGKMVNVVISNILRIISAFIGKAIAAAFSQGTMVGGPAAGLANAAATIAAASVIVPQAFAKGGIAYGPTIGMIGEYPGARSNPEVIAPLNKLRDMIQPSMIQGESVVRGQDLYFIYNEVSKQRGRNN